MVEFTKNDKHIIRKITGDMTQNTAEWHKRVHIWSQLVEIMIYLGWDGLALATKKQLQHRRLFYEWRHCNQKGKDKYEDHSSEERH